MRCAGGRPQAAVPCRAAQLSRGQLRCAAPLAPPAARRRAPRVRLTSAGPETEEQGSPLDFPEARKQGALSGRCPRLHPGGRSGVAAARGRRVAPWALWLTSGGRRLAGVGESQPQPAARHLPRLQAAQAAAAAAHAGRPGGAGRRGHFREGAQAVRHPPFWLSPCASARAAGQSPERCRRRSPRRRRRRCVDVFPHSSLCRSAGLSLTAHTGPGQAKKAQGTGEACRGVTPWTAKCKRLLSEGTLSSMQLRPSL